MPCWYWDAGLSRRMERARLEYDQDMVTVPPWIRCPYAYQWHHVRLLRYPLGASLRRGIPAIYGYAAGGFGRRRRKLA